MAITNEPAFTKCPKCYKSYLTASMVKARKIWPHREKNTELVCQECSWLEFQYEVTDAERKRVTKRLSKLFYDSVKESSHD